MFLAKQYALKRLIWMSKRNSRLLLLSNERTTLMLSHKKSCRQLRPKTESATRRMPDTSERASKTKMSSSKRHLPHSFVHHNSLRKPAAGTSGKPGVRAQAWPLSSKFGSSSSKMWATPAAVKALSRALWAPMRRKRDLSRVRPV